MLYVSCTSVTSSEASPPRIASFCWTSGSMIIVVLMATHPIKQMCCYYSMGVQDRRYLLPLSSNTILIYSPDLVNAGLGRRRLLGTRSLIGTSYAIGRLVVVYVLFVLAVALNEQKWYNAG